MRRQFDEQLEIRTTRRVIEEQVSGFASVIDYIIVKKCRGKKYDG